MISNIAAIEFKRELLRFGLKIDCTDRPTCKRASCGEAHAIVRESAAVVSNRPGIPF